MFRTKSTPPPIDQLTVAERNVARLATALSAAEAGFTSERQDYDRQIREFVASGRDEPSFEPQRAAAAKVESLRRLLAQAREELAWFVAEGQETRRIESITTSGGTLADLVVAAEAKIQQLLKSIESVRRIEAELFDLLFDERAGLRQRFNAAEVQRNADFARNRLRQQTIKIAERSSCMIDARFETDGEIHLGPLERTFYVGR